MSQSIADIRTEYLGDPLSVAAVHPDPIAQFERWFSEAERAELPDPNAMTLATVDADGRPRARIVLLKGVEERGFVFFTNYESAKGMQCDHGGAASLVFFWQPLFRQVRVEGAVRRVPAEESQAYFARRPRESQIGAWASPQSRVVASRAALEASFERYEAEFPEIVPCPPHWGGFVVEPDRVEFWQGRPARLHDRVEYLRTSGGWDRVRLAP